MRISVRLSLLLTHCSQIRLVQSCIRYALLRRHPSRPLEFATALHDARIHAERARDTLRQWLFIMRRYQAQ